MNARRVGTATHLSSPKTDPAVRDAAILHGIREMRLDAESLSLWMRAEEDQTRVWIREMISAGRLSEHELIPIRARQSWPRCTVCGLRLDLADHWLPVLRIPEPARDGGLCWLCEQERAGVDWQLSVRELVAVRAGAEPVVWEV